MASGKKKSATVYGAAKWLRLFGLEVPKRLVGNG